MANSLSSVMTQWSRTKAYDSASSICWRRRKARELAHLQM
ncbi:hypothetical protein Poly41_48500 [Novipirellula artificiosorum]|uniref:Uncharacterized protein n=1 Tax=Novipirellula artificiosorum TaxID=2528016 RepID=A0A5C6DAC6_9BACT|nr:hypothetical protein Poly41_48500 [Novipirellula artificiosorum]